MELAYEEADLAGNHRKDGSSAALLVQPPLTHKPDQEPLLGRSLPPPCARADRRNTSLLETEGELPEVCLSAARSVLFGAYRDWVHQNPGTNLDVGVAEYGTRQKVW